MNALDDDLSIAAVLPATPARKPRNLARTLARNSAANVGRIAVTSLVSIVLPAFLTHHLPVGVYSAWVLVLQLSAYVGYLDFGVQTAVSKYIAEFDAKQDYVGCSRCSSAGLMIMLVASILGTVLTVILAWRVPIIFRAMPHTLYHDVSTSVLYVGVSLAVSLATSVFLGIFLGLQQYQVPTVITIGSRILYGVVICAAVELHCGLIAMGAAVAGVNVITAVWRVVAWRKLANHISVSLRSVDRTMLKRMLNYCVILTVLSVCMLFISGLDITIVGRYAFNETGYYAIANAPTTFVLMIISAVMGPLLPAASALSVHRSAAQMGGVLLRATRYATMILLLTGLPFLVAGYSILHLWVGPIYAMHSLQCLRVLVLANIIRNLCSPYATMVVAMSRQRVATASAIVEALVNLGSSIWLAQHVGAIGVALGTLLGAVAGVAMHFGFSMRYTRIDLAISRTELFAKGMLRPAIITLPSILLLWRCWSVETHSVSPELYLVCGVSTALLVWFVSMTQEDRVLVRGLVARLG